MKIILEKRSRRSRLMTLLSPLLAIAITVVIGGIIFAGLGLDPPMALYL
jgi:ABC-type uncharacterized transport system permease subunit